MRKRSRLILGIAATAAHLGFSTAEAHAFSASATPDGMTTLYHMRCGPGWTGADATYSVKLPNGNVAWLFSDTFVGRVAPNGSRAQSGSSRFITGNTMNVQNASTGALTTYLGNATGTTTRATHAFYPYDSACPSSSYQAPSDSRALFRPATCPSNNPCWYWVGDGTVESGNTLRVFLTQWEKTGSGAFDVRWVATSIASLPTGNLTAAPAITGAPFWSLVMYGTALLPNVVVGSVNYTYVYGVRDESTSSVCRGRCMHVARVRKDQLTTGQWSYYAGRNANGTEIWSTNGNATQPLTATSGLGPVVANEYSVTKLSSCGTLGACYVLITHGLNFSKQIFARYATSPTGPWSSPVVVYETPESTDKIWSYNSHAHAWSVNTDGLLVSYNVNADPTLPASDPRSVFANAGNYRPKFIRVKFQW